jgi:hypothetical protein
MKKTRQEKTMNLYLMEKMAREHDADLNAHSAHSRPRPRASQARQPQQVAVHAGHPHPLRRRTGWALVSLGLRMTYVGEE